MDEEWQTYVWSRKDGRKKWKWIQRNFVINLCCALCILYTDLRSFIVVLLTAKIGFICHEAVTSLKLLEKGFSKEDLALSVLLDFPLQIFFGYYAAKWSNGPRPLKPVKCYNTYTNI